MLFVTPKNYLFIFYFFSIFFFLVTFFSLHFHSLVFFFSSFLVSAIFWTFPYYPESTLWTSKYQFRKLCLHCKRLSSGPAGLQGGFSARVAWLQFVDTCVRIRNVTVLSYLVFTLYKLCRRPLYGHRYTFLSSLNWFLSLFISTLNF